MSQRTTVLMAVLMCACSASDPDLGSASLPARVAKATTDLVAGESQSSVRHDRAEGSKGDRFFQLLNQISINQIPLDEAQLVNTSPLIVRGTIAGVADGRVLDHARGASNPIHTAVVKFKVDSISKGSADEYVYVEFVRGGIPAEDLHKASTGMQMMLFLHEADGWNLEVYEVEGEGRGLPTGETLYTLRTQQGLIVASGGRVEQPLTDDESVQVFDPDEAKSLDDVERRVSAAQPAPK